MSNSHPWVPLFAQNKSNSRPQGGTQIDGCIMNTTAKNQCGLSFCCSLYTLPVCRYLKQHLLKNWFVAVFIWFLNIRFAIVCNYLRLCLQLWTRCEPHFFLQTIELKRFMKNQDKHVLCNEQVFITKDNIVVEVQNKFMNQFISIILGECSGMNRKILETSSHIFTTA